MKRSGKAILFDLAAPPRRRRPGLFFLAFGLAGTVLLSVLFVLPSLRSSLAQPGSLPRPDYGELALGMAEPAPELVVTLAEDPLPALVVGANDGTPYAAIAEWDKFHQEYRWGGLVRLAAVGSPLAVVTALERVDFGSRTGTVLAAKGPALPEEGYLSPQATVFFLRDGSQLRLLRKKGRDGIEVAAGFVTDSNPAFTDVWSLSDLNGDGISEVLFTHTETPVGQRERVTTEVYRLQNGVFEYHAGLSQQLSVRDSLFPQPVR